MDPAAPIPPAGPGGGPPAPVDPAQLQQQITAAAAAVAAAQQALINAPPVGLGNYPLAAGDVVGDSFLTCGFTTNRAQLALHHTEGLSTLEIISELELDQVSDIAISLARRAQNQGGYRMTATETLNLKSLAWWLKDRVDRAQPIVAAFTPADLIDAKAQLTAYEQATKYPAVIDKPEKFPEGKKDKWVPWWDSVKNYLASQYGVCRRTLDYVVRTRNPPTNPTAEDTLLHQVTLTGAPYRTDSAIVCKPLKQLTLETTAHSWVSHYDRSKDGRRAALALMDQYEGDAQNNARYAKAKADLETLHYKGNEAVFPFQLCISRMRDIFTTMDQAGRTQTQQEQVEKLIDKMDVDHDSRLLFIKMTAKTAHPNNFLQCTQFISTQISTFMPTPSHPGKRGRLVSSVDSRPQQRLRTGERGGQGRGRGWRGGRDGSWRGGGRGRGRGRGRFNDDRSHSSHTSHGTTITVNGVDISDPQRTLSSQEMDRLGTQGQALLFERRRFARSGGRGNRTNDGGGRFVSAVDSQTEVSTITQNQEGRQHDGGAARESSDNTRGGNSGRAFGQGGNRNDRGRGRRY